MTTIPTGPALIAHWQRTPRNDPIVPPIIEGTPWRILAVVAAYVIAICFSGAVVRYFILPRGAPTPTSPPQGYRFDISVLIGKCENIIGVTCLLTGDIGGLALIFAAKSWVRAKEIERNPTFYLGGTLVNLTWSMLVGGITRILIAGA